MKIYQKIKNLFSGKNANRNLLKSFENYWKEFAGSIYDSIYNFNQDFLNWKSFGQNYSQKIIQNMSPVLANNNFGVYFTNNGFVFERRNLESML
jgi:phosphoglucomutase